MFPERSSNDFLRSKRGEMELRTRAPQATGLDSSVAPMWHQRPGGFLKSHTLEDRRLWVDPCSVDSDSGRNSWEMNLTHQQDTKASRQRGRTVLIGLPQFRLLLDQQVPSCGSPILWVPPSCGSRPPQGHISDTHIRLALLFLTAKLVMK